MMTGRTLFVSAFIAVFLLSVSFSVPLTIRDVHSANQIGSFDTSPYTGQTVYSRKINDLDVKTSLSNLFIFKDPALHSELTPETPGVSDHSPKFTFDGGHVLFLSNRDGSSQIYSVPVGGGPVTQLTDYPIGITSFKVSRNFIVFSADIYFDCKTDFECTSKLDKEAADHPHRGVVYDSLYVRHWDEYRTPGKVSHLFLLRIMRTGSGWKPVGHPVDLSPELYADTPVKPFGGEEQYNISPFENQVSFTAELIKNDTSWNTSWGVYVVDIKGLEVGEPKLISYKTDARAQNPAYSKDGQTLAFLQMDTPQYEADKLYIVLYNVKTSDLKPITQDIDVSVSGLVWHSDTKLYVDYDHFGSHVLGEIDINELEFKVLVTNGTVSTPVVTGENKAVFLMNSYLKPNEIYSIEGSDYQAISDVNPTLVKDFELVEPEHFNFETSDGTTVYGYMFYPYGFEEGKKYPVAHLIHGGPQGAWNNGWSTRWNPQAFAARGYVVVVIDPRGSTGYGQDFTDAVRMNWGGEPYQDLMEGLDYALETYTFADENKLFACGASYGGYMINWIESQTNRYRALVNHNGLFDLHAAYYATEELFFFEHEFLKPPYIDPEFYEKWTPSQYVDKWQTPMLVIHSAKDFRIDEAQGIATFTTLQRRGIKSRLLFFPEENHWVLNPANSVQWYDSVLGWLDENHP